MRSVAQGSNPRMADENFVQRIASVDRVIGRNDLCGYSVSLTGEDARNFINAIASARQIEFPGGSRVGLHLGGATILFYRGPVQVYSMVTGGSYFKVNNLLHQDTSGLLLAFNKRLDVDFRENEERSSSDGG
jgi:hypothetical protein